MTCCECRGITDHRGTETKSPLRVAELLGHGDVPMIEENYGHLAAAKIPTALSVVHVAKHALDLFHPGSECFGVSICRAITWR